MTSSRTAVPGDSRFERVDLRMASPAKRTLQRAAVVANKTLTEFLLDRGPEAAHEVLADRRAFLLEDGPWDAFTAALDAPPAKNFRLRALVACKAAWEA